MILTAGTLVTGDGRTAMKDGAVLVDANGRIGAVGPAAALAAQYPGEETLELGDATLLPGLTDMHVHLGFYYSQPGLHQFDDYLVAYYAQRQAALALEKGITTVRDMSSPHGLCQKLRLAAEKGWVNAPRIVHSDAGICMTGGHGHGDGVEEADGPWEIRAAIRRQLKAGADWVKILTSHRTAIPEFTQEELDAAVDECRRRGIKTAVHAGIQPSIEMCIRAGFTTIEHGTFLTVDQAKRMAEAGIAWTPTIYAYTYLYEYTKDLAEKSEAASATEQREIDGMHYYRPAFEAYRDNFKKLYDTGVVTLCGSDMVMYGAPALPVAEELALMVQYGITPLQAIQTATANAADVLGLAGETGRLAQGLAADLVVVAGNAAADIGALKQVRRVYQGGRLVAGSDVRS